MAQHASALIDVVVQHDGPQPIGVYKLIQRASALDITQAQARKLFNAGKQPVIPGLPLDRATALKVEFEALGATVQLRPSAS